MAFEINVDGIVEVTASDPNTGEQASTSITLSSGLSEGDLDTILRSDRAARVAASKTAPAEPDLNPSPSAQQAPAESSLASGEDFAEEDGIDLADIDLEEEVLELAEGQLETWAQDENEQSGPELFDASVRDLSAPEDNPEEL